MWHAFGKLFSSGAGCAVALGSCCYSAPQLLPMRAIVLCRSRGRGNVRGQVEPPGKLVIAFVSALIVCSVAGVRGCGRGKKVTVPRITTRGI